MCLCVFEASGGMLLLVRLCWDGSCRVALLLPARCMSRGECANSSQRAVANPAGCLNHHRLLAVLTARLLQVGCPLVMGSNWTAVVSCPYIGQPVLVAWWMWTAGEVQCLDDGLPLLSRHVHVCTAEGGSWHMQLCSTTWLCTPHARVVARLAQRRQPACATWP